MRTYTAEDIIKLIDILRSGGDIPAEQMAGMDRLGELVTKLAQMSDADIENEVRRYFRAV
jgi:hypothetical protein